MRQTLKKKKKISSYKRNILIISVITVVIFIIATVIISKIILSEKGERKKENNNIANEITTTASTTTDIENTTIEKDNTTKKDTTTKKGNTTKKDTTTKKGNTTKKDTTTKKGNTTTKNITTTTNPNKLYLSTKSITVDVGKESKFSLSYEPKDANWLAIGCGVNNSNAKLNTSYSPNGVYTVTGVHPGKSIITCYNSNGGTVFEVTKTIDVNVIHHKVESIDINKSEITVKLDNRGVIPYYTILPENASNKNVVWYSDNPSIARVNNNGAIYGVSEGRTTVYVKTIDGNKMDKIDVNVEKVHPTSIKIKNCPRTIKDGTTYQLEIEFYPENTTDKSVTWSVYNNYIGGTVDQNGLVSANHIHYMVGVRVTSNDNGVSGYCTSEVSYSTTMNN